MLNRTILNSMKDLAFHNIEQKQRHLSYTF